jgi:hypothetical protein
LAQVSGTRGHPQSPTTGTARSHKRFLCLSTVKDGALGIANYLAAVEAAVGRPEVACGYGLRALDQLERTWYAVGVDRVREVRRALAPHQHERCVRELDDRLYDWPTTVSALSR